MHIFFDLDGTLVDTISDISLSVNLALKKNGLEEVPTSLVKTNLGHGSVNLITKCSLNRFSSKLYEDYRTIYQANLCNLSRPYDKAQNTLEALLKQGHILGVYSNKDEEEVKKIINHYYPNLFKYIYGKRSDFPLKPDPAFMEYVIKTYNINDLCYVGDMDTDKTLAKNLGVPFIYASYGYSTTKLDSDYTLTKFSDLGDLIAKITN